MPPAGRQRPVPGSAGARAHTIDISGRQCTAEKLSVIKSHGPGAPVSAFSRVQLITHFCPDILAVIAIHAGTWKGSCVQFPVINHHAHGFKLFPCTPGSKPGVPFQTIDISQWPGGKVLETILAILRESPEPVTIITVGSLRDVAAAFNRDAALFHQKLKRLYAFIGNTGGGFREYNVNLDLNAYRCIMNAGLPLYWTPCFDGGLWENNGRASYWVSPHNQLLEGVPEALLNFFIYMIEKKDSADPVAAIFEPVNEREKEAFLAEKRNLWCCAVFPHAADRFYICRKGKCLALPPHSLRQGDLPAAPFSYVPVKVRLDEEGVEHCPDPDGTEILCFHMTDPQNYARHMTELSVQLLHELAGLIRTSEK